MSGNRYDVLQEAQMDLARLQGCNVAQMDMLGNPDYDYLQMEQIRLGLVHSLSMDCVAVYANPLLPASKMLLLRMMGEAKIDIMLMSLVARPELSMAQAYEVYAALMAGLPLDLVAQFATHKLTPRQTAALRLENEVNRLVEKAIVVDFEKVAQEAAQRNESGHKPDIIKLDGFSDAQLAVINLFRANGATDEQMGVICNKAFAPEQMQEIRWGFELNHLVIADVLKYAKDVFKAKQMASIRKGLATGLSNEEITLLANPAFSVAQMTQILNAFDAELKVEQVAQFADPEIPAHAMNTYWLGLADGMTIEEIREQLA
jgi:hypothetical protein